MPLPQPLQPLVQTRRFWTDFLWETYSRDDAYPELASCTINLPVAGGYGLSLSLDAALSYFSLQFTSPGNEAAEIAWDDLAHPYPHILRWQELELLCRAIAVQDAELPHPGILLLLLYRFLYRFAPICIGDDLDIILPMLESAWRQLDAARLLYALLSKAELMLLPMAIATFKPVAETVTAAWPNVLVVESASALHDIFMSGPYAWWLNQHDTAAHP